MEYRCRRRQRARRHSGICVAIAVTLLVSHAFITSLPAAAVASKCLDDALSDVDGGGPDAIVGLPSYDLPGKPDAGALLIFSNVLEEGNAGPSSPTRVTLLTANDISGLNSQAGARFGAAVVIWRDSPFDDDDDCADLLVGAPGQNVNGIPGAGEVYLIRGTASGPDDVTSILNEADLRGTGGAQAGAGFGTALAADTAQTVAIGAPGRDVGTAIDAGRVVRLDYTNAPQPKVAIVEQGGPGADRPEHQDRFGEVLELLPSAAGPLVLIGVPHEDVGVQTDAGAVGLARRGGHLSLVTQDSPGAGGIAEAGDRYGAAVDSFPSYTDDPVGMVAIGVPGEDVGQAADAGMVAWASVDLSAPAGENASPITGLGHALTQDSSRGPERVEAGDGFGATLVVGEFSNARGLLDLVVGTPFEDLGAVANAGAISSTPIKTNGSVDRDRQVRVWTRNATGEGRHAYPGDRFGAALSSIEVSTDGDDQELDYRAQIMTVPGRDLGSVDDAAMAYLLASSGAGSVSLTATIGQDGAGLDLTPMLIG